MFRVPNELQEADLSANVLTIATCWRIVRPNGPPILGTNCGRDVKITTTDATLVAVRPGLDLSGTYRSQSGINASDVRSSSDLAVDNLEVEGVIRRPDEILVADLTVAEWEAGILDRAPVTVFMLNYEGPDRWQEILKRGHLGECYRDSDGRYRTEVRGLAQALSQTLGDTFSEKCTVKRFGDHRCKFPVETVRRAGEVTSVIDRQRFTISVSPSSSPPTPTYFQGGVLAFTDGDNAGFEREPAIAEFSSGQITITLWDEMPFDIAEGDAITIEPGCDRLATTCRDVYDNLLNIRAYGLYMPGIDALTKGPV